jgi:hypothetical protein
VHFRLDRALSKIKAAQADAECSMRGCAMPMPTAAKGAARELFRAVQDFSRRLFALARGLCRAHRLRMPVRVLPQVGTRHDA